MTERRRARLNEQFKREISEILMRKVQDPRVGTVLVTDVRVTADLWMARVFVRPQEEDGIQETLEGLEAAESFIRRELADRLHLRRIPELRFIHDTTLDSARRIEEILQDVLPPDEGDEGGEEGEDGSS
jgi:ribosome-binding factor A